MSHRFAIVVVATGFAACAASGQEPANKERLSLWQTLRAEAAKHFQQSEDVAPPKFTPEEQKWADEAKKLHEEGAELHRQGRAFEAVQATSKAVELRRRVYKAPKFPKGHQDLCQSLLNLSVMHKASGQFDLASARGEEACAMAMSLFPPGPSNATELLVDSVINLGVLAHDQGRLDKALIHYERALKLSEDVYSSAKHPNGHPKLANQLINLATLQGALGNKEAALKLFERGIAMYERLYSAQRFPNGHARLASAYSNVGSQLKEMNRSAEALEYSKKALAMREKLYPTSSFPSGHPDVANSLNNVAAILESIGRFNEAIDAYKQCLAMQRRLLPKSHFPDGHEHIVYTLINIGSLFDEMGRREEALVHLQEALAMDQRLGKRFLATASERDAIDFVSSRPMTRDGFLTFTSKIANGTDAAYEAVWTGKLSITRVLEQRHTAARVAGTALAPKLAELKNRRLEVDQLLRDVRIPPAERRKRLAEASDRRDAVERELAAAVPRVASANEIDSLGPSALLKTIPEKTVLVDFVRYTRIERDVGEPGKTAMSFTPHYAAFILARGKAIRRVELGLATTIDSSVASWRRSIHPRGGQSEAENFGRLVWAKIAPSIPTDAKTLLLALDGELCSVPWPALPIKPDRLLIEDFSVASVPHGPFVLERLRDGGNAPRAEQALVVGALDYHSKSWLGLPGTHAELAILSTKLDHATRLAGADATPIRVAELLPKCSLAHFATHGYFDSKRLSEERKGAKQASETRKFGDETLYVAGKNPLGYVGLVLSGGEIFTGLRIVDLPLENLKLVTLSACETGLGDVDGDEGVQGLQRAFHLAGSSNVVASLWKIPDVPTLVLMEEFYSRLQRNENPLPPIEALREAQLTVMRNPKMVMERLSEMRSQLLKQGVKEDELQSRGFGKDLDKLPGGGAVVDASRSPTQWWAGFMLSGVGR